MSVIYPRHTGNASNEVHFNAVITCPQTVRINQFVVSVNE